MRTSPRIEHRQAELEAFLAQWFGDSEPAAPERPARPAPGPAPNYSAGNLSDDEILAKAPEAGNGAQFSRLFDGDTSGHNSDDSAADLALCNMLAFWTDKDADQMDRLFRRSGLYRGKWDEKHGRDTYGNGTIAKAIAGCRETYSGRQDRCKSSTGGAAADFAGLGDHADQEQPAAIDPAALLGRYEVKAEYVEKLGKEEFLIENLLVRGHILVCIAMSGGGKTTFWFRHAAPLLAGKGLSVWYLDADSPASEHKIMKELADKHKFRLLNPDANVGAGISEMRKDLEKIATSDHDLSGWVLIFDTLKKFTDLMSKGSVKDFFTLCRKLTGKGATVVLLGHANKYRSKPEGHLIAEGVGDVRSDTDELIFFERRKNENTRGLDITTDPDPDHGAKVRGIFRPFSFHIGPDREVTLYDKPVDMPDHTLTATPTATEEEILDAAAGFLAEAGEPVAQTTLVSQVRAMVTAGRDRVRALIVANSMKDGGEGNKRFVYTIGARGRLDYSLPQREPEQSEMFDAEAPFRRDSSFLS